MRTMYDSIHASAIPANAKMVAGYVDGLFKWSTADWARFPHAVKVRIACFGHTDSGQVLDVEAGNATPAQAPAWVSLCPEIHQAGGIGGHAPGPDARWSAFDI